VQEESATAQEGAASTIGSVKEIWTVGFYVQRAIGGANRRVDCGPSGSHRYPSAVGSARRCMVFKPSGITQGKILTRGVAIEISAFVKSGVTKKRDQEIL
jgi:hypothetical protein